MPFKGKLTQGVAYTFQVRDLTGGTAATFLSINRRDKIASVDPQTVANGETKSIPQTFGTQIDRLELGLYPSTIGGQVELTVLAGTTQVFPTETFNGDTVVTYDTLP